MQRTDVASRRFYRLFYQWTVLTYPPRPARACLRLRHESTIHTTACVKDVGRREGLPDAGIQPGLKISRYNGKSDPRRAAAAASAQYFDHSEGQGITRRQRMNSANRLTRSSRAVFEKPVQSATEKPFSSVQPGELIVRYKSETSLMLEVAVLGHSLQVLREEFGQHLEKLNGNGRARVEVQGFSRMLDSSVENTPRNTLHSILVTGTFDETVSALSTLRRYRTSPSDHANIPKLWLERPVQSADVQPFRAVKLWDFAVRFRSETTLVLELAFPGPVLQELERKHGRNLKKLNHGATVEIQRASDGSFPAVTSMLISGPFQAVFRAYNVPIGSKAQDRAVRSSASSETPSPPTTSSQDNQNHGTHLEMRIAEPQWAQLTATHDINKFAESSGAKIIVGEPEQQSRDGRSTTTETVRSVYILGSQAAIQASQSAISSALGESVKHVSDQSPQDQDQTVADKVRVAMRTLTHPVVVVTSSVKSPGRRDLLRERDWFKEARGVTVSSFSTVTMQHRPVVSFNLRTSSRTWEAIRKSTKMNIHVLAASPEGAGIADIFTRPHLDPTDAFTAIGRDNTFFKLDKPPRITRFDAILFRLDATLLADKCVEVGDHVIVVGEVIRCEPNSRSRDPSASVGLAYGKRGYRTRGEEIHPSDVSAIKPSRSEDVSGPSAQDDQGSERSDAHKNTSSDTAPLKTRDEELQKQNGGASVATRKVEYPLEGDRSERESNSDRMARKDIYARHTRSPRLNNAIRGRHQGGSAPPDQNPENDYPDDPVYGALRATRAAEQSGEDIDAYQIMNDIEDAMNLEDSDKHRYGYGSRGANADSKYNVSTGTDVSPERGNFQPLWGADDVAREDSARLAEKESPGRFGSAFSTPDAQKAAFEPNAYTASPDEIGSGATASDSKVDGPTFDVSPSRDFQGALWTPEDMIHEDSARLAEKEAPRRQTNDTSPSSVSAQEDERASQSSMARTGSSSKPGAFGLGSWFKRPYSTNSRTRNNSLTQMRGFSSSSVASLVDSVDELVEPAARHMTVADFLGLPDGDKSLPTHRLRSAVKMNNIARDAERRLQDEAEFLTEKEKSELEHTLLVNNRIVSKKLAWNAAGDLRIMLDKGRVDFERAQFFESAIEKGQAVLLEEAKHVRKMLDEGKISGEKFQKAKESLEKMNGVLITETNRLRQLVDEE